MTEPMEEAGSPQNRPPHETPTTNLPATKKKRRLRRGPIRREFNDQVMDLHFRALELRRLSFDSRYGRNREQLAKDNLRWIDRAINELTAVRDRLHKALSDDDPEDR